MPAASAPRCRTRFAVAWTRGPVTRHEISPELDREEIRDWLDSLDAVIDHHGLTAMGRRLLQKLTRRGEHAAQSRQTDLVMARARCPPDVPIGSRPGK